MKWAVATAGLWLLPLMANASPHVTAYERFYAKDASVTGGALLYSELGCANCHGSSPVAVPRKGPSLESLSSRVDYNWTLDFLRNPEKGRKGSTMPMMMHGMQEEAIQAVAAYLSTLGKGLQLKPARHANAELGSALYHEQGCVACHAPTNDFLSPEGKGRDFASPLAIAFPDLKSKTSLVALEHFLANTSLYRRDGRMPHMELGRDGAVNVAAHLLDIQGSDPREVSHVTPWPRASNKQVAMGRALVEQLSCAACHDLPSITGPKKIPLGPVLRTKANCLDAKSRTDLPRYELTAIQRGSLGAFLEASHPIKETTASLTLQAMNCHACHERDGKGGPTPLTDFFFLGDQSLGDSGRLPPPLTGVGHKLRKDWLKALLAGEKHKHVRPYLKTVMPSYPFQAEVLTACLVQEDDKPKVTPLVTIEDSLEDGRKLLGAKGGVNCITCHHWDDKPSLGIPGMNIASLDQRLRPEWFRSFLLNPASYRSGILMPPFWPQGRSTIPDILGGETEKQIAAIWEFIRRGKENPEGFPGGNTLPFELKPTTRPIVQRTFLAGAGTKAILVGFPGNIHLAYDGQAARPALIWRGNFFDAYSTWFMRMAPFEKPLSNEVYPFQKVDGDRRFRGYELDEKGNPTFLIEESGRMIRERFEVNDKAMKRTLAWEEGEAPRVSHPDKVQVKQDRKGNKLTAIYSWK